MTAEERQKIHDLEEENARLKSSLEQRDVFIRRTMASFLSDEVLEEVLESGKSVRIGGERRVVTMMFSDIRRSTQLSESMNATDFIEMLNHYLEEMIEILNSWQGNILSFVGDAIVTVFGAPRPNEDAARDAVACAVAMQRRMPMVNVWNEEHGYPRLSMGIGIHTGEAILGNIGSQTRAKYDMIGRNVNLASRIEGFTGDDEILISTETLQAAGDQVILNPAGERWVRPKGIQTDILIHEVIGYGSRKIQTEESDPESRGRSAAVPGSIPVKEAASESFEWRELDEGQLDREEG